MQITFEILCAILYWNNGFKESFTVYKLMYQYDGCKKVLNL